MSIQRIPLQEAAATRFQSSTTEEIVSYLEELGESCDPLQPQSKLRSRLLAAMGLTDAAGQTRRQTSAAVRTGNANDPIRPPYNLSHNGLWGGRRVRITIPRPAGAKLGRAEPLSWNGKATFWCPYDEVVALPLPLFEILKDRKQRRVSQDRVRQPDGTEEITTRWEFSDFAMTIIGDDPLTKDRAGSIGEWYRWKGPGWFKKRNLRELQSICTLLEIPLNKNDQARTSKTETDLLSDVLLFLYGHPDAEDAGASEHAEEASEA